MSAPLVSCIVAVFNGERYLGEALDSIVAQTYGPLEIIVVDDGSTDGTPAIVECHPAPITYHRQTNAGPPAARNRGLQLARGEWVSFLDADDRWHPDKTALQMACYAARPELEYCVSHAQNFWTPELEEEAAAFRDHAVMRPLPAYVTPALLARRALFDRIGGFDETYQHASEAAWFAAANDRGAIGELLPQVLVWRRLHRRNRSLQSAARSHDEHLDLVRDVLARRRRAIRA